MVDLINSFCQAAGAPQFATPIDRDVTTRRRAGAAAAAAVDDRQRRGPDVAGAGGARPDRRPGSGSRRRCSATSRSPPRSTPGTPRRRWPARALAAAGRDVRRGAVELLGGEPRHRHRPGLRGPQGARGQARRDHRRLLGHRPGHRAQGRPGRRHPGAGGPRPREARGPPGHHRAARRHQPRLPVRPLRPRRDRRALRAADHRAALGRLPGQQRRPLDPPVAQAQPGPLPRLRADHAAELLRRDPADHRADADDARAGAAPTS